MSTQIIVPREISTAIVFTAAVAVVIGPYQQRNSLYPKSKAHILFYSMFRFLFCESLT